MAKRKQTTDQTLAPAGKAPAVAADSGPLLDDLRALIRQARAGVARAVNSALVLLYWEVGRRIRRGVLGNRRANYGEEILATLSKELAAEFGQGFSVPNLSRMMRLAEVFPDQAVVTALAQHLGWSHFIEILALKDDLRRDFYAEMCRVERWSVRTLRQKVGGMLFERTALSRKPEKLVRRELEALRAEDQLTPDLVFRDPYFLNFLGLADAYSEADLEEAILRELEHFLLELGAGFTFVARQKRMTIGPKDYYLDLLFYHRILRRLVAVELKLEPFEASHKGQMELYLRWLEKYEVQPGEEPPLGLILCAAKDDEQVELLQLGQTGIRVASYLTDLPPPAVLRQTLQAAIERARAGLASRPPTESGDAPPAGTGPAARRPKKRRGS